MFSAWVASAGTDWNDVRLLAEQALREIGIEVDQVFAIASIDARNNEPAILEVAAHLPPAAAFF